MDEPTKFYAIKSIYKLDIKKSKRTMKAILNEVDIMRDTDHPNIIKIHEVYESNRYVYMITDYYDGGELYE